MADGTSPIARTKHGDLTLDDIGEMQPGMARLMLEVSERFWILYHAAKGGNWDLARHEFSETRKTLRIAAQVRPKYQEPLAAFESEQLKAVEAAIREKDWDAFDAAFRGAVDTANDKHREFGYEYIEWRLPEGAPLYLRLSTDEGTD